MNAVFGTFIGVVVIALGLAGLGVALAEMMTHANPNGTLISIGGLGVFGAAMVVSLILAR